MTRVAIPIEKGMLSNRLADCSHLEVFDIDNRQVVDQYRFDGCLKAISDLSNWVNREGITDVIVHYIDKPFVNYFTGTKINLYLGVNILTPEKLIEAYLNGTLKSDVGDFLPKA